MTWKGHYYSEYRHYSSEYQHYNSEYRHYYALWLPTAALVNLVCEPERPHRRYPSRQPALLRALTAALCEIRFVSQAHYSGIAGNRDYSAGTILEEPTLPYIGSSAVEESRQSETKWPRVAVSAHFRCSLRVPPPLFFWHRETNGGRFRRASLPATNAYRFVQTRFDLRQNRNDLY